MSGHAAAAALACARGFLKWAMVQWYMYSHSPACGPWRCLQVVNAASSNALMDSWVRQIKAGNELLAHAQAQAQQLQGFSRASGRLSAQVGGLARGPAPYRQGGYGEV